MNLVNCAIFVSSLISVKACIPSVTTVKSFNTSESFCSGDLIFDESFDVFNTSIWKHQNTLAGGGDWEFQWYVPDEENSFTKDGKLHIKPTLTSDKFGSRFLYRGKAEIPADKCTQSEYYGCKRYGIFGLINPIRSASISTINSFAFKYGTVEIRAKAPAGDWLWPSIWMLPKINVYGSGILSGEIDLMESRGNRKLFDGKVNVGVEQIQSSLHFGPQWENNGAHQAHFTTNKSPGFNEDFHNFNLTWTPEKIEFSIDDEIVGSIDASESFWKRGEFEASGYLNPWSEGSPMAPFDQEFYLIINLAVGGTDFFADRFVNENYSKPWPNHSPRAIDDFWDDKTMWLPTWKEGDVDFQIDYVRVFAL